MNARLFRRIQSIEDCEVSYDVDLSQHTTMRVGGKASCMAVVHTEKALEELIKRANRQRIPIFALGGGSNTIFMDDGFDGIVFKLGRDFQYVRHISGVRVAAGAGAPLSRLVLHALKRNLAGLEFCLGIPGTVGGALAGNAGTHNVGVCDSVSKVWGFTHDGERFEVDKFPYGYRYSWLRKTFIAGANFVLKDCKKDDEKAALKARVQQMRAARKAQPYNKSSAGCIFRNPLGDSAGRLIDLSGLKGFSVGDIEVSDRHANFIVNNGRGKAEDLVYLICYIRQVIKEKFDVDLQLEVQLVSSHPMHVEPKPDKAPETRGIRATVLAPSGSEPILSFS
ncbi:MAG: UDP-N-acetylmuramate dehydrogenase [Candidatus Sumerlaeia bacterium]